MTLLRRVAFVEERREVEAFYREQLGRDVALAPEQDVIVARDDGVIVGALRLCPEAGTLLLRTMVVAKDRRGEGIGGALLADASREIGARECWCFPWSYLDRLYGAVGFERVPDERVPDALRHRRDDGCIAMLRARR